MQVVEIGDLLLTRVEYHVYVMPILPVLLTVSRRFQNRCRFLPYLLAISPNVRQPGRVTFLSPCSAFLHGLQLVINVALVLLCRCLICQYKLLAPFPVNSRRFVSDAHRGTERFFLKPTRWDFDVWL